MKLPNKPFVKQWLHSQLLFEVLLSIWGKKDTLHYNVSVDSCIDLKQRISVPSDVFETDDLRT